METTQATLATPNHKTKAFRFLVVGLTATALSLGTFRLLYGLSGHATLSSMGRMVVFVLVAYSGYSRWMLLDELRESQKRLGNHKAELQMISRISASVGLSTLVKLVLEPILLAVLLERMGKSALTIVPLLGDLGYGPLINYGVLRLTGRTGTVSATDPGESR